MHNFYSFSNDEINGDILIGVFSMDFKTIDIMAHHLKESKLGILLFHSKFYSEFFFFSSKIFIKKNSRNISNIFHHFFE